MPQEDDDCQAHGLHNRSLAALTKNETFSKKRQNRAPHHGVAARQPGSSPLFLFADLLLISNDYRNQLFGLQILLGYPLNFLAGNLADEIAITIRIVQAKLKKFYLCEKTCHFMVSVETQRKTPNQVIFGVVQLLLAHRLLADAADFFDGETDRILSGFILGLHHELKRPVAFFRAKKTMHGISQAAL